MKTPKFEKSGDPTKSTLDAIEKWPVTDPAGLFEFICEAWCLDFGSVTVNEARDAFEFVTGGWAANEALIDAVMANGPIYQRCWQKSQRGGLYLFFTNM